MTSPSPILSEEERLEASRRLFAILAQTDAHEALPLCVMMLSEILAAYRVAPGSEFWKQFFKMLQSRVAIDMVDARGAPLN